MVHRLICLLLIALTLSACGRPHEFSGTEFPESNPAAEIIGLSGESTFQLSEHEGKVVAIFFGFTDCPDFCPIVLSKIQQAYSQIGATTDDVTVAFVTIDPERDTPDVAATYASAFNEDFIGVHVPMAEQEEMKQAYFLFAEKEFQNGETSGDNYLMAHSDNVYLIGRDGNIRVYYRGNDLVTEDFANDLEHLIAN